MRPPEHIHGKQCTIDSCPELSLAPSRHELIAASNARWSRIRGSAEDDEEKPAKKARSPR